MLLFIKLAMKLTALHRKIVSRRALHAHTQACIKRAADTHVCCKKRKRKQQRGRLLSVCMRVSVCGLCV